MNRVETCDRCDSRIVENTHDSTRKWQFMRYTEGQTQETDEAKLCSMCLDDLWGFVFDADIDRSDKADPMPVSRLSNNVARHISDLEDVLNELEDMGAEG